MSENRRQLEQLAATPAAVEWFRGLFERVHVQMTDTGESFTVLLQGDRAEVRDGLGAEAPNFVIPLESQNVSNLAGFFEDNRIDPQEEYRIVKFMLKPCLKAGLEMPVLRNPAFRAIVRIDCHWQEALLDPQGNEDEQLTVVYVNDQWLILPGYHGKPERRLVMTPAQVLEYQRRVFAANEKNTLAAWLDVGRWYLKWRDEVSVPV
jgi:hypothetical protein